MSQGDFKFAYFYFFLKVLDLSDTVKFSFRVHLNLIPFIFKVFIVLRKKNRQLSFLHCFHHLMMVLVVFEALRTLSFGIFSNVVVINSFVHTVMYFYYLLCIKYPQTWIIRHKKKITQLQIVRTFSI